MSGYLDRLKKISAPIGTDKTDKTAKSLSATGPGDSSAKKSETEQIGTDKTDKSLSATPFVSFGGFVSEGNAEIFFTEDERTPPFGSFGSSSPRENANFSAARCADCHHGKPATSGDPYSWHRCMVGNPGWWGMAPQRCERWECKP